MLHNIGYLSYITTMGALLLVIPSAFIKSYETGSTESFLNLQIYALLQNETGLRICGLFHFALLAGYILKSNQIKFSCAITYAIFIGALILGLLSEGTGQQQSEKLERMGFQVGIFSFILYNNWPESAEIASQKKVEEKKEEQEEKKDKKEKVEETTKGQGKSKKQKSKNE